jgi:hypothetical protein
VEGLSDHLFWDVDRGSVDPGLNAPWLVKRVLEYGKWSDLMILVGEFGKERLREIVPEIRGLDRKAAAFCRIWLGGDE